VLLSPADAKPYPAPAAVARASKETGGAAAACAKDEAEEEETVEPAKIEAVEAAEPVRVNEKSSGPRIGTFEGMRKKAVHTTQTVSASASAQIDESKAN
jgi:hypothetical protein